VIFQDINVSKLDICSDMDFPATKLYKLGQLYVGKWLSRDNVKTCAFVDVNEVDFKDGFVSVVMFHCCVTNIPFHILIFIPVKGSH